MRNPLKIILAVVIVSLVFNIYSIFKMNQLEQEINILRESHSSTESFMYDRLSNIQQDLYELKEGEKWVADINFLPNVEASSLGEFHLQAQWTFRELESETEVVFSYKKEEDGEWVEVKAIELSGTTYEAPIQIDPDETYMYKISAEGTMNRSSETEFIPTELYGSRELLISFSTETGGKSTIFEALIEQGEVIFEFYKIEKATANIHFNDGSQKVVDFINEIYDDGIELDYMHHELHGEKVWIVRVEEENMIYVEIEVTYADGSTEKQIFDLLDGVIDERQW
ncbi:hypothetical protein [Alkalihalobacterium elongatum]|uniref:hypothetical protein n=1 Tax=Alkalihalobacterium elongatum TaxID=2675466 RepID=UPI001C1F2736|nr:hypothetical protein [Alkalihalobacterium elongatum]